MMNKTKCDAILFDMDGTILDTVPLIVESFQHTFLKHQGRYEDEQEIIAGIGLPLETVFSNLPEGEREAMITTYIDHNHQLLQTHIGLFLGMPQLFAQLQAAGIKLGIVTSKRIKSAIGSIEPFELNHFFDLIQAKEATVRHKPDPQPLQQAMKDLGVDEPKRVMYVGDSVFDLLCAKNAGCMSAVVDWTRMDKKQLRDNNPDLWINTPQDLYNWVVND